MFAANTYKIRPATKTEGVALRELRGPILVGEVDGRPAAALSVADGRSLTDPFQPNSRLLAHLRMRAGAARAIERMPSLAARMRAGVKVAY